MLLPVQLGRQQLVAKKQHAGDAAPEFTGTIFCPQRLSGIAVLRCAEYQLTQHCGTSCATRASEGVIACVLAQQRRYMTDDDGAPKKARGYNKRSHLTLVKGGADEVARLTPGVLPHMADCLLCAMCGQEKKSPYGLYCRKCGTRSGVAKRAGRISRARRRERE